MALFDTLNNKSIAAYVSVAEAVRNFKRDQNGVTAVEYAIVIAGVAAVVSVIFAKDTGTVAKLLKTIFSTVESSVISNITG